MASGDLGLDFDGTGYAFLESPAFLAVVLALAVASYAVERVRNRRGVKEAPRGPAEQGEPVRAAEARDPATVALGVAAVALGALLFAGSLAAGDREAWPGLAAGAALALLGFVAVTGLLERVRSRIEASAASLLPAWADLAALALAAVAIVFPPAALLGIGGLVYLLVATRRAGAQKYEGLRILR